MVAQDDHAQNTGNITQYPPKKSKTITPHELNLKFSEVGDELNNIFEAYKGLTWLASDCETEFKHAFFILESINKRLNSTINDFYECKSQLIKNS